MPRTKATIIGIGGGQQCITTLRFMELVQNLAERQALANAIRDRFLNGWKTGCSSLMQWSSIVISVEDDPNDSPYILPINVVGGGSGLLPMQNCIKWYLQTGQAGKRGRGALFTPGLATATNSGGQVASATKLSLNAEVTTLIGRWCVGGSEAFHLGVFSRVDQTMRPVVTLSYSEWFSTLRSRMQRV